MAFRRASDVAAAKSAEPKLHEIAWRGQRASEKFFSSGFFEGEKVSRGASQLRRSSGGNLTTRDRALRVPYPSRLVLATTNVMTASASRRQLCLAMDET